MKRSLSYIFLTWDLCITIPSSNLNNISLNCVMQILIFSIIIFWSNWFKLSLISLVEKAMSKCSDLISKFFDILYFPNTLWKSSDDFWQELISNWNMCLIQQNFFFVVFVNKIMQILLIQSKIYHYHANLISKLMTEFVTELVENCR